MTTPTNWPNPERPGAPLFPERDGWHIILGTAGKNPTVFFWNAQCRRYAYSDMPDGPFMDTRDFHCVGYRYHGPALTPAQISEMLAGERERAAEVARRHMNDAAGRMQVDAGEAWVRAYAQRDVANEIEAGILMLGDAL